MPQGFDDIESGAALSQKLLGLVGWLEEKLKAQPVYQPLTGKEICLLCYKEKRVDLEGPDVRAMVNYLRRREKPVGSQSDGYFWAKERQQLDGTIVHLRDRLAGIQSALRGLLAAKDKLDKGQQELL